MKVLFLQNKGKSYGGVWQVNKLVGENLIKDGYEVTILSIRENHIDYQIEHDPKLKVETINKVDDWETYNYSDIFKDLKHFNLKLKSRLKHNKSIKKDIKKLHEYINNYKPDYIISSHYQLLDMIPKNYLNKTFHEQHLTFRDSWNHRATRKTLIKFKNKVTYIWLCDKTKEEAIKSGLTNSISIYNAVRFKSLKVADVINNKKIVTIARLSTQKRIDKMVNIMNTIFEIGYKDWVFEIYGDGSKKDYIESLIKSDRIKLMGRTDNPKKILLSSSINLNTSDFEGFPLGILEASECGVPTIAYNFGESTSETIINNKTGFIVNNEKDYINKLKEVMDNPCLLKELSKKAKENSSNFQIENIIKKWEEILK